MLLVHYSFIIHNFFICRVAVAKPDIQIYQIICTRVAWTSLTLKIELSDIRYINKYNPMRFYLWNALQQCPKSASASC